ncbi:MAG TPA: hypothetical protein VGA80_06750 [Flavobacteriaceae bacterium]
MLNTSRIGEMKADGTDAVITYTFNKADRRASSVEYTVDETYAAIALLWVGTDDAPIEFPVLKKQAGEGAVVDYAETISVSIGDIVYGYMPDATTTWVTVYPSGFKAIKYLVNLTITEILAL